MLNGAMRDLVIIGARSHAREIFDAIAAVNTVEPTWNVLGFVGHGETQPERIARLGPILGDFDDDALWRSLDRDRTTYIVGIGSPADREAIAVTMADRGYSAATVVHPSAVLGSQVVLGEGCYVAAQAAVMANAKLGRHVHINVCASVSHDCEIGDFSMLDPHAGLAGEVVVGRLVEIGTGAVARPKVRIGDGAVIGAQAAVVRNIGRGVTAIGVPARPMSDRTLD